MTLFEEAVLFAVQAHSGMKRKKEEIPYILHPMEVASITSSMTADERVLAAAVLHDTVEDTPTTIEQIEEKFGKRVAELVSAETEDKRKTLPPEATWKIRKEESLEVLKKTKDLDIKRIWLGDKLSNMRSYFRLQASQGNGFWNSFNQHDPAMQEWYYRSVAELTSELKDTSAWKEYNYLLNVVFEGAS